MKRPKKLRRRYGRMLPFIPIIAKLGAPLAKLATLEKAERALEPIGRLAAGGWAYVTGGKVAKKKRKKS
jgi:hypothetical protein